VVTVMIAMMRVFFVVSALMTLVMWFHLVATTLDHTVRLVSTSLGRFNHSLDAGENDSSDAAQLVGAVRSGCLLRGRNQVDLANEEFTSGQLDKVNG